MAVWSIIYTNTSTSTAVARSVIEVIIILNIFFIDLRHGRIAIGCQIQCVNGQLDDLVVTFSRCWTDPTGCEWIENTSDTRIVLFRIIRTGKLSVRSAKSAAKFHTLATCFIFFYSFRICLFLKSWLLMQVHLLGSIAARLLLDVSNRIINVELHILSRGKRRHYFLLECVRVVCIFPSHLI